MTVGTAKGEMLQAAFALCAGVIHKGEPGKNLEQVVLVIDHQHRAGPGTPASRGRAGGEYGPGRPYATGRPPW